MQLAQLHPRAVRGRLTGKNREIVLKDLAEFALLQETLDVYFIGVYPDNEPFVMLFSYYLEMMEYKKNNLQIK